MSILTWLVFVLVIGGLVGFRLWLDRPDKIPCKNCGQILKRVSNRRYPAIDRLVFKADWRAKEEWRCESCGFEKTTDVPDLTRGPP